MYSRDFGGIKSDGQFYNYEREYNESRNRNSSVDEYEYRNEREYEHHEPTPCEKPKGVRLDFLRNMRLDDLLDSDGDNDIFVLLIALLFIF